MNTQQSINPTTKELLRSFSSKKDCLTAIGLVINELESSIHYSPSVDNAIVQWFKTKKEVENYEDRELAQQVMDYFNEVNGTAYRNLIQIRSVIKQIPSVTLDQFQSVIMHKHETWGSDPKMRPYIRPATLFGSKNKFITYLEDSTNYWIQKQKTYGE